MKRHALIFGLVGGLLMAALQYTQYRFIVIEHSLDIYGALVAVLFSVFGIWLGLRLTRGREVVRETVVVKEVLVPAEVRAPGPFTLDRTRQKSLGITERELEVLALVAGGFSNREIAAQLSSPKTRSRHTVPARSTSSEPPGGRKPSSAAKSWGFCRSGSPKRLKLAFFSYFHPKE